MAIGKQIKLYLVNNNISQKSLSKETGMTPAQLSAVLNEKRKMTIDDYISITIALKIPFDTFIDYNVSNQKIAT